MLPSKTIAAAFELLPGAYALVKPDRLAFTVASANRKFRKLLAIEENLPEGTSLTELFSEYTSQNTASGELNKVLGEVLDTGEPRQAVLGKRSPVAAESDKTNTLWRMLIIPVDSGEQIGLMVVSLEVSENGEAGGGMKKSSGETLRTENIRLEGEISRKIIQHESTSRELNDFIYSVSHDLRAPLRRIDGFSQELLNEYQDRLDETGSHYLRRVRKGVQDMGRLIDDLLKLSRISRRTVELKKLDLGEMGKEIFEELCEEIPDRKVELKVEQSLPAVGDEGLLRIVMTNLLSNALKFSSKEEKSLIEIGRKEKDEKTLFFVRDNGVGFNPDYSDKLFKAFQRLHSNHEFEGSGIGLATVKRIVTLHGGEIRAESRPGEGATFYFTL